MFCKEDMRKYFNLEILSEVNTDILDRAIAGILQQKKEKEKLIFIAYYTRSLTNTEQQYNIHDKELLTIVHVLQHQRVELQEVKHEVLVKTDHHNL